jgi:predicted ATPase
LATLLQTLTRDGRLARVPLHLLSAEDIAAIARRLSPGDAEPLAQWLAQFSEGNPYILAELVNHAQQNNILQADGKVNFPVLQMATSPVVPQTIYSLIESRLNRLSDPARRVLDAAVAAGREFDFEIVARAAALSESAALDALDELRASNLIHPAPDDSTGRLFVFDHTLTMEVAYREVGQARHRLLHYRIAEALEAVHRTRTDKVAGLIASHFAEGNTPERAAPYALRAGQLAAGLAAWAEAAEKLFADGLALAERLSIPERLTGLTANQGLVAARRGQTALAIHRLSTALAQADALGTQHLAAQIRLWLIPLLPSAEARAIAESGNRRRLLGEAERLEKEMGG